MLGTMHFRPVELDDAGWFEKETGFCVDLPGGWTLHVSLGLLGWMLRSPLSADAVTHLRSRTIFFHEDTRISHAWAHVCLKFAWIDVLLCKTTRVRDA